MVGSIPLHLSGLKNTRQFVLRWAGRSKLGKALHILSCIKYACVHS